MWRGIWLGEGNTLGEQIEFLRARERPATRGFGVWSLDDAGREVIRVDTARPWNVESVDGVTECDVLPELVVEL